MGFKAENLDQRTGSLAEAETGVDYACVVAYHQGVCRQQAGKLREYVVFNLFTVAYEQFARVAHGQWVTCNALIGQGIVKLFYLYISWIAHLFKFSAKISKIHGFLRNFAG